MEPLKIYAIVAATNFAGGAVLGFMFNRWLFNRKLKHIINQNEKQNGKN